MRFTVIIPSRNIDNVVPCIQAVREHEPDCGVLVVDDGLNHFLGPMGVRQIVGEKPFVFARNINNGIRAAACHNVILLNDDALLQTPGGFSVMAQAAEENPNIGIIGAACNNVGNPNQFPKGIGLRGEDRMVCFVCVYIPRRTIERVGLLDERYTDYGLDDDDYCFEIRKAGLEIAIHDGCIVDHKSLPSSFRGPAGAGGDFRGNLEIFKEKWGMDNWGRPA
jgi:hypothetical protein